ncbi:MAG: hypothetical protein JST26_03395 [Bacteroidetes bacterium]|nr:hypothetical protein [Bacteroidota bacterium]
MPGLFLRLWLAVLFVGPLLYSGLSAQEPYSINKTFSPEELRQDLDHLARYLPHFHPDPYRYISKDSLMKFVEFQKASITTPLTEREFRVYVKQVVAKIGCGHTDINASRAYNKAIKEVVRPLLPVNVFITDSMKLMILNDLSDTDGIFPGDEIVSIDHVPTQAILNRIFSTYTADGYINTSKRQGLRYDWFKYFYGLCYGFASEYKLGIKHQGQVTSYTLKARPSTKDSLYMSAKPAQDTIYKTKTCQFWMDKQHNDLAVIRIHSFDGRHWRKFYRKTFHYLRKHKVQNLVIDLRDNGGGDIGKGLAFMSYIIPKPFCVYFDRKPNLIPLSRHLRMPFSSRVTPILFTLSPLEFIRHGRLRHYMPGVPKHRNRYRNQVYVMVNGKTFSMSSIAASYLKYKAGATIVGEETGGCAMGSNAIVNGKLYLPHSGINISIPIYHIYHDLPLENNGRGVMPDYPVHYTVDDVFLGRDQDLEKVRALIRK